MVVPSLSFAIGRGLSNAIVGYQTSFTIFSISKKGRFIPCNDDDKYQVIFEDERKNIVDFMYDSYVDKDGKTIVSYTPKVSGRFLISIMLKKEKICLSPYELHVLDVESKASLLQEMTYSGWDVEAAAILANLSGTPMFHEKIFQVGLNILLHLLSNHVSSIRRDMLRVFLNLFTFEENKIKVLKEGKSNFIKAVTKSNFWTNTSYSFYCFIYRMMLFWLENGEEFNKEFIDEVGFDSLTSFKEFEEIEILRYISKIYWRLSTYPPNLQPICDNSASISLIVSLLQSFDHSIQRVVIGTLRNLSQSRTSPFSFAILYLQN